MRHIKRDALLKARIVCVCGEIFDNFELQQIHAESDCEATKQGGKPCKKRKNHKKSR